MRRAAEIAFAVALVAVFAWSAYESLRWPPESSLFPLAITLPGLALALMQTALSLRARPTEGPAAPEASLRGERGRRTLEIGGWTLGFVVAIWLLGFVVAVPIAAFLYLRLAGREGWVASVGITALCWAFVYFVFDRALHVPLPVGPLLALFGLE